ncbi:MAG: adenylate/guanylate cyclase domain-containing protein [Verrucomicrobiota bacterium]
MTLGKTIVFLLVGLLVGTVLLIGSVAFFTTRASVESLRDELMVQIDEGVQAKMQGYFDGALPALEFMEGAVFIRANVMEEWEDAMLTLARFLRTEPDLQFLYYGDRSSGGVLGVIRDEEGRYLVNRTPRAGILPETYEIMDDGRVERFEPVPGTLQPYDARARPWFQEAVRTEGVVWTAPYVFLNSEFVGITAAVARRDGEGRVEGVFAADIVLRDMAAFLDDIEVGKTGTAFLMLGDGTFPVMDGARGRMQAGEQRAALRSADLEGELVALEEGAELRREIRYGGIDYVALIEPIELPGRVRYFAGVIVPTEDFMGEVWRNAWLTVGAALLVLGVAIVIGVWLARRVTEPLAVISGELEGIGKLSFPEGGPEVNSSIREVALFSDSVGKMKVSLMAFSKYVPRDLVRTLLARGDEAKLGGRLQSVTVQFTDLAGFTTMSEGMSPDEAFAELSEFLEVVAENQHRVGGITSNFTGDGTLAIFNAPEPLDHHEEKAVQAALDTLSDLRELNGQREREGKLPFRARLGINTAEVLLGNLGTRDRFAYTAIGDGVNLASRIEGLGKLYGTEILVGEECRQATRHVFEWRMIDRIAVVGRRQSVVVYEPLGKGGEVSGEVLQARDLYEQALEHYFSGDFEGAERVFDKVRKRRPGDMAAAVMVERCRAFQEVAPPAGWDGVYVAPFK